MDRADANAGPTHTSDPAPQAEYSQASLSSSDGSAGQNRLIQYIRSMPLVSFLFSRSVPPGTLASPANRVFIFKCLMIFHLLILISLIGITSFAVYHFDIRFYKSQTRPSETLIVCWLLRAIWHTINSSFALKYHASGTSNQPNLRLSHTFYNIASILWISLAVVFLGVSPREDLKTYSARICYFLLWITIASYVVPMLAYTFICVLLYLTLFVVIYFRNGSISLVSQAMPAKLLKKLKIERYSDVIKKIQALQSSGTRIPSIFDPHFVDLESQTGDGKAGAKADASPPAPDDMAITMERTALADCVDTEEMLNERICSICILTMNPSDRVFVLPCDLRHLFHRDCLKKWFKRSSECPICRSNIADLVLKSMGDGGKQEHPVAPDHVELSTPNPDMVISTPINDTSEPTDSDQSMVITPTAQISPLHQTVHTAPISPITPTPPPVAPAVPVKPVRQNNSVRPKRSKRSKRSRRSNRSNRIDDSVGAINFFLSNDAEEWFSIFPTTSTDSIGSTD